MTSIHCFTCAKTDLPADDGWLSVLETAHLATLRFPKRRGDWRLGRFTAKQALAAHLATDGAIPSPQALELRPAADGAPEPFHHGAPLPVALSLSHAGGWAFCALAPAGTALGCDIEQIEPRSAVFVRDYFTPQEQALVETVVEAERAWLATLIWSAKESALKALRTGLRRDTREVEVRLPERDPEAGWWPLVVTPVGGDALAGWWCPRENLILTLVAAPPPAPPRWLVTSR